MDMENTMAAAHGMTECSWDWIGVYPYVDTMEGMKYASPDWVSSGYTRDGGVTATHHRQIQLDRSTSVHQESFSNP